MRAMDALSDDGFLCHYSRTNTGDPECAVNEILRDVAKLWLAIWEVREPMMDYQAPLFLRSDEYSPDMLYSTLAQLGHFTLGIETKYQ